MQDGGSRHLEKSKNRNNSATGWRILTTFGTVKHPGSPDPLS